LFSEKRKKKLISSEVLAPIVHPSSTPTGERWKDAICRSFMHTTQEDTIDTSENDKWQTRQWCKVKKPHWEETQTKSLKEEGQSKKKRKKKQGDKEENSTLWRIWRMGTSGCLSTVHAAAKQALQARSGKIKNRTKFD